VNLLPIDLIYGLLLAVVAAPTNAHERAGGDPTFSFGDRQVQINEVWASVTRSCL